MAERKIGVNSSPNCRLKLKGGSQGGGQGRAKGEQQRLLPPEGEMNQAALSKLARPIRESTVSKMIEVGQGSLRMKR